MSLFQLLDIHSLLCCPWTGAAKTGSTASRALSTGTRDSGKRLLLTRMEGKTKTARMAKLDKHSIVVVLLDLIEACTSNEGDPTKVLQFDHVSLSLSRRLLLIITISVSSKLTVTFLTQVRFLMETLAQQPLRQTADIQITRQKGIERPAHLSHCTGLSKNAVAVFWCFEKCFGYLYSQRLLRETCHIVDRAGKASA